MTKKFDPQRVDAALKRAGKTAVTGSPLERSGRFLFHTDAKNTGSSPKAATGVSSKRK
jgi:hypothetical protein